MGSYPVGHNFTSITFGFQDYFNITRNELSNLFTLWGIQSNIIRFVVSKIKREGFIGSSPALDMSKLVCLLCFLNDDVSA